MTYNDFIFKELHTPIMIFFYWVIETYNTYTKKFFEIDEVIMDDSYLEIVEHAPKDKSTSQNKNQVQRL